MAQAFIIALYAEMYGLPLTMYLLAWLTERTEFAQDHFYGHAWAFLLGWGETGAIGFDIVGQLLIVCGAALALLGWRQVHRGRGTLVTGGLYRFVRHPQYTGFFLFLLGSVLNWPTLPTHLMLPVLLWVYYSACSNRGSRGRGRFRGSLPRVSPAERDIFPARAKIRRRITCHLGLPICPAPTPCIYIGRLG